MIPSGCYCALTIATLLNILTPQLAANTSTFIASCQTYEGGLASSSHPFTSSSLNPPLGEAHGGYTFCAVASWAMLRPFASEKSPAFVPPPSTSARKKQELNLKSLMRWSSSVQAMPVEGGGFRGRTNKLVDGCYSWWCGGLFGVLGGLLAEESGEEVAFKDVFDRREYCALRSLPSISYADFALTLRRSPPSQALCKSTSSSPPRIPVEVSATSPERDPTATTPATTSLVSPPLSTSTPSPPRLSTSAERSLCRPSVARGSLRSMRRRWK
jgi:hypothetical protein